MEERGLSEETKEFLTNKISEAINITSTENRLNMPDFIIAEMMVEFLNNVVIAKQDAELHRMSNFTIDSI